MRKIRDWKKLTFYYFADSYINFNSLVTDLFKVYKTRIWMSAMNPASFAHPTTGLPGGPSMGEPTNDSNQQLLHPQLAGLSHYPQQGQQNVPSPAMRQQYPSSVPQMPNFPHRAPVAPHADFSHLPQQQHNGYAAPYMNGLGASHHQGPMGAGVPGGSSINLAGSGPDWMSLQGLSLHSH